MLVKGSHLTLTDTRNAFHGSDSPVSAKRELNLVFEGLSNSLVASSDVQMTAFQDSISTGTSLTVLAKVVYERKR